jgi:hypothetical protein
MLPVFGLIHIDKISEPIFQIHIFLTKNPKLCLCYHQLHIPSLVLRDGSGYSDSLHMGYCIRKSIYDFASPSLGCTSSKPDSPTSLSRTLISSLLNHIVSKSSQFLQDDEGRRHQHEPAREQGLLDRLFVVLHTISTNWFP